MQMLLQSPYRCDKIVSLYNGIEDTTRPSRLPVVSNVVNFFVQCPLYWSLFFIDGKDVALNFSPAFSTTL